MPASLDGGFATWKTGTGTHDMKHFRNIRKNPENEQITIVPIKDLLFYRNSIYNTMDHYLTRKYSHSLHDPIELFYNTEIRKYLVQDGIHRIFESILLGKNTINALIIGEGEGYQTDLATPHKEMQFIHQKTKYGGLEDLADEEILDDIKDEVLLFRQIKRNPNKFTLYHSTHRKNLKNILKYGLIPQVGEITSAGHSSNAAELVYFSSTPLNLYGGNTITFELINPQNYDIYYYDGYGLQPINGSSYIEHEDIPVGVEEGDYFTEDNIRPEDLNLV